MPVLLAVFCAAVIGIFWVSINQPDNGRCLAAHTETYTETDVMWIPIGDTLMPFYSSHEAVRSVCDRWEFPMGRPAR